MRLVSEVQLTQREHRHVLPSEKALELVRQAFLDRQPIEGLEVLRAGLLIDLDSEVLDQIERGEWRLVSAEADFVEWTMPDRAFDPKVMDLMQNPPAQPSRSPRLFRLIDSVTCKPLSQRQYLATVDGDTAPRRTDGEGIAHLFTRAGMQRISMKLIGV